ncbi:hypothetical protein V8C34DRAFT_5574 [Trichoderma compactum]
MSAAGRMLPARAVRTRLALALACRRQHTSISSPSGHWTALLGTASWPAVKSATGAKAQSHREAPCKWREMGRERMGRRGPNPKPPSPGRQPLISTAARITAGWPCPLATSGYLWLTTSASPWVLSPGHQPSKWNVFRLFWGGQGKQVVQVNPTSTTSRRTRWALRVLRYLANFWSTWVPPLINANADVSQRPLESSAPNRGQGAVPVWDFACECVQSLGSMSERLSVATMCTALGNR